MDKAEKKKDDAEAELDEAKQRVKQLGAISSKTADDVAALAEAKAAVERLTKTYDLLIVADTEAVAVHRQFAARVAERKLKDRVLE
jgi:hypothetical protein